MRFLHPIRLESSLHETIWGGRRLERDEWKELPPGDVAIGEAWETETSTLAQNTPYTGKALGELVEEYGEDLLGSQVIALFGHRFPLLAKFIDANAKLSVQVHPDDYYAAQHETGKLGKTEFWYILDAAPGASIIHGFKSPTSRAEVQRAIATATLENLLHEVPVASGDVIFVPAGTVHAIGAGVLLYELQEYSDVTYRMYDYGRLTLAGTPRELHVERSLDVSIFDRSRHVKMRPVWLADEPGYTDRCLAACQYFVSRILDLRPLSSSSHGYMKGKTGSSCVILTSLSASMHVFYSEEMERSEALGRGQTMVLPAALGQYRIEGEGAFILSYVPEPRDEAWAAWKAGQE
ncbi:MAG TPA: type I phosphomannose isomerase catalytic subunit [Ktedonobacteraceae bacterium]|nr:type I phosphomannose isomerase catalytic subunit [Ktedonobacteraceae bacterium]